MKIMNHALSTALIAALVILLTACGGSRPKGELPPPAEPPAPAPVVQPAPPPPPPPPAPEPIRFDLEGVHFDSDRAVLKSSAQDILDHAANVIAQHPDKTFRVGGHTDSQGGEAYNRALSERRVASVIEYLVGKGVSRGQLVGIGYGEDLPVADNGSAAGRAMNRRVEILEIQ